MKFKILFSFILLFLISSSVLAQDTTGNQTLSKDQTYPISSPAKNYNVPQKHHIYRDTRLGSSSPYNNTYKKNDYGAGAITTNPGKSNGISTFSANYFDSTESEKTKIYRDTRLGSSSSPYNTYQKNDDGAGAITTNPHKE